MTDSTIFWRSLKPRPYVRRAGMVGTAPLVLTAAALLLLCMGQPACAQVPGLQTGLFDNQRSENSAVRLYFLNHTWMDVLNKVAEQTGSTLVADQVPQGRFSRLDRKQYTRADAVRILNTELEPLGYRLIEKGEFLVLFNLHEFRNEYRRPTLSLPEEIQAPPSQTAQNRALLPRQQSSATTPRSQTIVPVGGAAPSKSSLDMVEQAAAPVSPPRRNLPAPAPEAPSPATVRQAPTLLRVALERQRAVDVARTIYDSFKPHARLLDAGPTGLPAFCVNRIETSLPQETLLDYTVDIDTDRDELIVSAPESRAQQIGHLIQTLDTAAPARGEVRKLALTRGDTRQIIQPLQAALHQLVAQNAADKQTPAAEEAPPEAPETEAAPPALPENGTKPPAAQQPPEGAPARGETPPLNLDLQGPVTVRDVPGVGLVVTGNRGDVDAVLNVIRLLEIAGKGVVPDLHLLKLKHVQSEALAELLTSVYTQLSEVRAGGTGTGTGAGSAAQRNTVRVVAVVKPNAVLVIAPAREMESVLELAEALDQPVDPAAEVEVFQLKHAVARQVVTHIDTFYATRAPLGTRVRAVADVRTNSVIVYARDNDLAEVARLIRKVDLQTSGSVSRMRIFPLKNAVAAELATLINSAIQSVIRPPQVSGQTGQFAGADTGNQTPQELRDVKSAILEFLASDGDQQRLVRSGILADIRVTADPGRNALIVAAPEQSLPLMEVLIAQLDQPTPLVAEIKVFTLANSDATAMSTLLQQLFASSQQQQQTGGFGQQGLAGQIAGGIQFAGAEGAGAGLIPVRFSVDARTNTIIAIGSGDALQIVEAVLLRLDASDVRQRRTTVVKLKNSPATDVATAINQFLTAQRDLAQLDPNLVTSLELLEREIIVVPEIVSNSLLISSTPRYYQDILDLVTQLDQKPPEVVIQALLVEVSLDNADEFGVELGLQDQVLFQRSLMGLPGFLFNNAQLGNNTAAGNTDTVGTQGLSSFGLSRTNSDLGFGGLVLAASSESVSVLIRALAAQRTVQVLSRPQIRTLDNQLAQIQVGQQVPVPTGVAAVGLGSASPTVELRDVGIILAVVPRISPEGSIVMEVSAIRSSLSAQQVPIFTDISTGNVVNSPIFNVTTAQATVSVPNGQTVILGGMITKMDDAFERKVPWLGDIPVLGHAFRYDSVRTMRTELLIFLTPRVVRHEADSELIKRVEAERLHFVEHDAEELHGPLYSAPPPDWYLNRFEGDPAIMGPNACPPGMMFDEGQIPTTIMPSLPRGSVVPIPLPNGKPMAPIPTPAQGNSNDPGLISPVPVPPEPSPPQDDPPLTAPVPQLPRTIPPGKPPAAAPGQASRVDTRSTPAAASRFRFFARNGN